MILIDTDHVTLLKYPDSERGRRLLERLKSVPHREPVGVAIVTIEEQMRGWLAAIAKERTTSRVVVGYRELARLFEYFRAFEVVSFDEAAAFQFDELRGGRLRLGTMDLRIGAIALARNALLLSANLQDFQRVPGLRVENWLD